MTEQDIDHIVRILEQLALEYDLRASYGAGTVIEHAIARLRSELAKAQ